MTRGNIGAFGRKIASRAFLAIFGAYFFIAGFSPVLAGEIRVPEKATGRADKKTVYAKKFMVSAAHPLAVKAGYQILKEGGSAADAAVAVQMALNVVEPQSSGIGGGAFLLYWDNSARRLAVFDGRETAPAAADQNLFLDSKGKREKWEEVFAGGRSVGVPGLLKMLGLAHKKHGKLPWARLFKEAVELAEKGFAVSPRLSALVSGKSNSRLGIYDDAWRLFYPNGRPAKVGTILKNLDLADTFKRIAALGPSVFYKGDIAIDIVKAVKGASDNPGLLTEADMKAYKARERPPVCGVYRSYKVCGAGPPGGGVSVIQILSILNNFDPSPGKPLSKESVHLFSQAGRLAYADRNAYVADPDFVNVPIRELLDPNYLKRRASMILHDKDMGKAKAGRLGKERVLFSGKSLEAPSTTHISIVDADGNAVSMTSSIEMGFGSTLMARGFLLNNQLTDFSFLPERRGKAVSNRVEGGKRPRSSMSPAMVFDKNNNLKLVLGSPGGSHIINYVARTIVAIIDWNMDVQRALNLPHFGSRNDATYLEKEGFPEKIKTSLEKMGHRLRVRELNSGTHAILITGDGLAGGADPRREGVVMGE